jgi:hypothetical protein
VDNPIVIIGDGQEVSFIVAPGSIAPQKVRGSFPSVVVVLAILLIAVVTSKVAVMRRLPVENL